MPLLWNRNYGGILAFRTGSLHAQGLTGMTARMKIFANAMAFGNFASQPQGYQSAARALVPSIKTSGFIAARLGGEATMTGALTAVGNMAATLAGDGTMTGNANMASNAYATLAGEGTLTPGLTSIGWMSARLDAGAQPSAFDIAQEVIGTVVESGVDLRLVLRAIAALTSGKTSGGGTGTVIFRNPGDTLDRITMTVDANGNRSAVVLNPD